jgi:hypothetical protein
MRQLEGIEGSPGLTLVLLCFSNNVQMIVFILVIRATQEQRAGKSQFEANPGQTVCKTLSQGEKKKKKTTYHTKKGGWSSSSDKNLPSK